MQDPVFGEIDYDRQLRAWQGVCQLKLVPGEETRLAIHSEGVVPDAGQQKVYQDFCNRWDTLKPRLEKTIFGYHKGYLRWINTFILPFFSLIMKLMGQEVGDGNDKTVDHPHEVWKLLGLPVIEIPHQEPGHQTLALLFECEWEPEHGFMVLLQDWEVKYRGIQG